MRRSSAGPRIWVARYSQVGVPYPRVVEVRDIKGAHLKTLLSDGKRFLSGVMWRQTSHPALKPNSYVDIVFRPEVSTYQGTTELQANLQAIEPSREHTA